MAKEYQGHKCWAYWNVSLYLFNDEGTYRMVQSEVKRASTLDVAAQNILNNLPDKTPDGAKYSKSAIRAALVGCKGHL